MAPSRLSLMAEAVINDDGGWTKHSDFHWSRIVAGKKLDYYPSKGKFQFGGKIKHSDVYAFIKTKTPKKVSS